jgi:sialate O-acetylesterase
LQESLGVPIGLVQIAWGGTPIDSWTSLRAITADAALMPVLAEWARMMEKHTAALLRYHREATEWKPPADRPVKPVGPEGPWKPGSIFNAMIAPATRFPIRGVIWYQGESNTAPERAPLYARLFRTMIEDWRRAWGQGDFPFLFVQLAGYTAAEESQWPELREAQRQALGVANTAMAVAIDLGEADNIHPKNKQEVGRRLSLAARAIAYGERVEHSGPLFRQATREGAALRLWFDHAEGLTAPGGRVKGFEIAGADREYVAAEARIEGATVVISSPEVATPVHARYGWTDYPDCNLYNAAGLPASPFRYE